MRLRKLLEVFRSPERILAAGVNELRQVEGVGVEVAQQVTSWESPVDLAAVLERIRSAGGRVIAAEPAESPKPLRENTAPPSVL